MIANDYAWINLWSDGKASQWVDGEEENLLNDRLRVFRDIRDCVCICSIKVRLQKGHLQEISLCWHSQTGCHNIYCKLLALFPGNMHYLKNGVARKEKRFQNKAFALYYISSLSISTAIFILKLEPFGFIAMYIHYDVTIIWKLFIHLYVYVCERERETEGY